VATDELQESIHKKKNFCNQNSYLDKVYKIMYQQGYCYIFAKPGTLNVIFGFYLACQLMTPISPVLKTIVEKKKKATK
jgi:hypothetical protein